MQTPPATDTGRPIAAEQQTFPWYSQIAQQGRRRHFAIFVVSALGFFALFGAGFGYRLVHEGKVPDLTRGYLAAADRLREQGNVHGALAQYRIVFRIAPDDDQTLLRLGVTAYAAGEPDEAIAAFSALLRREPRHVVAHQMLGALYIEREQFDRAIRHSRAAIRLRPRMAEAYSNLGTALLRKGETAEAIASYRRALLIDPSLAPARMSLASLGVSPEGQ